MKLLNFVSVKLLAFLLLGPFILFACDNGKSGGGSGDSPDNPGITHTVDFDYLADATNSLQATFISHPSHIEGVSGYSWNFNDGNGSVSAEPVPVYTFSKSGSYDVTLTVTYAEGNTAIKTKSVTVAFKPYLASGESHSFYVSEDNVYVWGRNNKGQLGINSTTGHNAPVAIAGLNGKKIISVSGGFTHSLALSAEGKVYAWGNNINGQLGKGTINYSNNPANYIPVEITDNFTTLTSPDRIIAVSAGKLYSLALSAEGKVYAWGDNEDGQLGKGTIDSTDNLANSVPVDITNNFTTLASSDKIIAVSAGEYHSLALSADGRVYTWGNNYDGQLGDGSATKKSTPVDITDKFPADSGKIKYISAGYRSGFAISVDDKVYGWGKNDTGELGLGAGGKVNKSTPIEIPTLSGKNLIIVDTQYNSSIALHSVALGADGVLYTWGNNSNGQLGLAQTTSSIDTPTAVPDLSKIVAMDSGNSSVIVLDESGVLKGWGNNVHGQVGIGSTIPNIFSHATITIPTN